MDPAGRDAFVDAGAATRDAASSAPTMSSSCQPGARCDDGNPCTINDVCANDRTCTGVAKSCDDGRACSEDSCDESTGACAFDLSRCACAVSADCDDGNDRTRDDCDLDTGICSHSVAGNDAGSGSDAGLDADSGSDDASSDAAACTTDACSEDAGCISQMGAGAWVGQDTELTHSAGASIYSKAQSFLAPSASIAQVDVYLCPTCTTNKNWEIRIVSALPQPSLLADGVDATDRDAKTLATAGAGLVEGGWVTFTFSPPISLVPCQQYFVFMEGDQGGAWGAPSALNWMGSVQGAFPGLFANGTGWILVRDHWSDNSNALAPNMHQDFGFRVWPN